MNTITNSKLVTKKWISERNINMRKCAKCNVNMSSKYFKNLNNFCSSCQPKNFWYPKDKKKLL